MKWTVDPHGEGYILQAADFLRKGIPDAKASFYRDRARGQGAVFHILGNTLCQLLGFQGHEIHQVVNVKHVSGGEKPVLACLIMLIHNRAPGPVIQPDSRVNGKLVFRNQAYRQDKSVAGVFFFRSGNGL